MIEWIQHWDEMRFFFWSPLNWLILLPVYLVGAALIALMCWLLAKLWKPAWLLAIPLALVLAIAPFWEELDIAWNFGQLCKKDAGIFVYKTVEVEGFFDDTHSWRADKLRESGFKWMEGRDRTKSQPVYWRHQYAGDEIRSYKIDQPTARYHYSTEIYGSRVAHKITRQESLVTDQSTGEILGRYVEYGRRRPWFFVGLGEPSYSCDGPDGGPNSKHNRLIYREVLKPIK